MKLWAWRCGVAFLGLVLAFLAGARMDTRRRVRAMLLVGACLAAAVFLGAMRASSHVVLMEIRSASSILHWVLAGEILALLAWLALLSREPLRARALRLACVSLLAVAVAAHDAFRLRESGIRQEVVAQRTAGHAAPPLASSGRGDWPCWRGPSGNNHVPAEESFEWRSPDQVVWKSEVPGEGHSSPCVWGDRIFLTTAHEKPPAQIVLAFHRDTGERLWERTVHQAPLTPKHPKNSYASSTPCCDGRSVYAVFSNASAVHVTSLDMESGRVLWQTRLGDYINAHNYGSSPAIFEDLVVVPVEGQERPFVAAVYRDSGAVAWRTRLRLDGASYASPMVMPTPQGPQIILPTKSAVVSLDPATGRDLWSFPWAPLDTVAAAVFDASRAVVTGTYPSPEILALDLSAALPCAIWRSRRGAAQVPSPILAGNELYVVSDEGIATCFDAGTGAVIWKKRLGGEFSASPLLVGETIYAVNEAGRVFAFGAAREFHLLRSFDLPDPVLASPVLCGGRLFVRTARSLTCIRGEAPKGSPTRGRAGSG